MGLSLWNDRPEIFKTSPKWSSNSLRSARRGGRRPREPPAGRQRPAYRSNKHHRHRQQQDRDLHRELQGLIAPLEEQLQFEEQSPPPSNFAEQQQRQSSLDAFKKVLADLQRQDSELQGLIAQDKEQPMQRDVQSSPGSDLAEQQPARDAVGHQADELRSQLPDWQRHDNVAGLQTARDALEHQAADLRSQIADLQQQDDALGTSSQIVSRSLCKPRRSLPGVHASLMRCEAKRTRCGKRSIDSGSSARRRRHYWRYRRLQEEYGSGYAAAARCN